ncbi:MAG: membrane protein insertion efficiency factor YidD [Candidatus Eremiobacteraeota bacterium]|nr:membrane protein insertion efficiency factor YidD [Candidatus Eremiobacteraeota bacterium]
MSVFVRLIRTYQRFVSKALPAACRFSPTCSEYGAQAIERYGAIRGMRLLVGRLSRCGPWHPGGADPLPDLERETLQHSGS